MPIVTTEDICKNQPRIEFTRVTVGEIMAHVLRGRTKEWIINKYDRLSEKQIDEAIAYGTTFKIRPLPMNEKT